MLPGHHDPGLAGRQEGGHGHQLDVVTLGRKRAPHDVVRVGLEEALRRDLYFVSSNFGNLHGDLAVGLNHFISSKKHNSASVSVVNRDLGPGDGFVVLTVPH